MPLVASFPDERLRRRRSQRRMYGNTSAFAVDLSADRSLTNLVVGCTTRGMRNRNKYRPSSGTAVYPHMPFLRVARAHARDARAIAAQCAYARCVRFWAFGEASGRGDAKFPQHGKFPALDTLMNRSANFDAASFILGGEIRNRTNKRTQTNKQNYKQ